MVERFHNVINVEGVFKLRDRKPSDAPKPVPDGLVEKSKYIGSFGKEKTLIKSGFSNFERHLSEKLKGREGVKRVVGRGVRGDEVVVVIVVTVEGRKEEITEGKTAKKSVENVVKTAAAVLEELSA